MSTPSASNFSFLAGLSIRPMLMRPRDHDEQLPNLGLHLIPRDIPLHFDDINKILSSSFELTPDIKSKVLENFSAVEVKKFFPKIKFNYKDVLVRVSQKLLDIRSTLFSPFISGGAVQNAVIKAPLKDLDLITFLQNDQLDQPLKIFIEIILERLKILSSYNFESSNCDIFIRKLYLSRSKKFEKESFIQFGLLDWKFFGLNGHLKNRFYISQAQRILIPLFAKNVHQSYYFAETDAPEQSLLSLEHIKNRIFQIYMPGQVKDLLSSLIHANINGYTCQYDYSATDLLGKFLADHPTPEKFKDKLIKVFHYKYGNDEEGGFFTFFHWLKYLDILMPKEKKDRYIVACAEAWLEKPLNLSENRDGDDKAFAEDFVNRKLTHKFTSLASLVIESKMEVSIFIRLIEGIFFYDLLDKNRSLFEWPTGSISVTWNAGKFPYSLQIENVSILFLSTTCRDWIKLLSFKETIQTLLQNLNVTLEFSLEGFKKFDQLFFDKYPIREFNINTAHPSPKVTKSLSLELETLAEDNKFIQSLATKSPLIAISKIDTSATLNSGVPPQTSTSSSSTTIPRLILKPKTIITLSERKKSKNRSEQGTKKEAYKKEEQKSPFLSGDQKNLIHHELSTIVPSASLSVSSISHLSAISLLNTIKRAQDLKQIYSELKIQFARTKDIKYFNLILQAMENLLIYSKAPGEYEADFYEDLKLARTYGLEWPFEQIKRIVDLMIKAKMLNLGVAIGKVLCLNKNHLLEPKFALFIIENACLLSQFKLVNLIFNQFIICHNTAVRQPSVYHNRISSMNHQTLYEKAQKNSDSIILYLATQVCHNEAIKAHKLENILACHYAIDIFIKANGGYRLKQNRENISRMLESVGDLRSMKEIPPEDIQTHEKNIKRFRDDQTKFIEPSKRTVSSTSHTINEISKTHLPMKFQKKPLKTKDRRIDLLTNVTCVTLLLVITYLFFTKIISR